MSKPSVLLIGAGFVGGTVLDRLLKQGYPVSVTYRREDQASVLKSLGVTPIKASLDDAESIEEAVSKHDVLINTASSDHPGSVEASLKGIERRIQQGLQTIYIHTSGTGVLTDVPSGKYASDKVFSDDDSASIEALDDGAPHRLIDKNIVRHAAKWHEAGQAKVRVILPPLIWGKGSGPFNQHSIQIPGIIKTSITEGAAVVHGPGKAVWSHIDVQELADGYIVLLESLLKGALPPQSQWDYYVFAENGEFAWIEISQQIKADLETLGIIGKNSKIKELTDEEALKYKLTYPKGFFPGLDRDYQGVGSNSRSRAVKLRAQGWEPKEGTADLLASLKAEVEYVKAQ